MPLYGTSSSDSQTGLIIIVGTCLIVGCCMCINTQHIIARADPRKAEKDLLTTLSSCCNSMRAGMQQKGRNGSKRGEGKRAEEGERESEWHK